MLGHALGDTLEYRLNTNFKDGSMRRIALLALVALVLPAALNAQARELEETIARNAADILEA